MNFAFTGKKMDRNPWLAAMFSLVAPPAGHLYAGSAVRAIVYAMVLVLLIPISGCKQRAEPVPIGQHRDKEESKEAQQVPAVEKSSIGMEILKDLAEARGEEFGEKEWMAESKRQLTPNEWTDMEIDLGLRPHPNQTQDFTKEQLKQLLGNARNLATIRNGDKVTFYLLATKNDEGFADNMDGYQRLSQPRRLTAVQRTVVLELLSDARNYGWMVAKGCVPSPGIALKIESGDDEMMVVYCFACNVLAFYQDDAILGGEDFDMMRPKFVAILKSLYPKNKVIQQLPLDGCGLTKAK